MVKELPVFAQNLRTFRKELKLTQAQFAEKCFLSEQTIKDLETGRKGPGVASIKAITFFLGVPSEQLFIDYSQSLQERNKILVSPALAKDIGIDYYMLQKITSLGENEMDLLKKTVDTLYELSTHKAKEKAN